MKNYNPKNPTNRLGRFVLLLFLLMISFRVSSNWIIFSQRYTADPAVIVYNGRVYVYLSHDTDEQRNFSMDGYTCISSDDLLNWTDHGEVLMAEDIPYISVEGKPVFWAPEAIERNGKFYLYFCTPDYGNDPNTTGTGVCVSDSPIGPFSDPRGSLMIKGHRVDVGVMIDDDGQAYAYWPNGLVRKLRDNMYEYADGVEYNVWNNDAHEAPYVKKINNQYYYMYMTFNDQELWACSQHNMPPDGCGDGGDYFHRYNFLNTPTGGIKEPESKHGRTMMWPVVGDNTQPAVFEFNGNHYCLYHSKILSKQRGEDFGFQRNVGLDRIYFNEDGTIVPQTITKEGLRQAKYLDPYIMQEAETIGREERIETEPSTDIGGGRMVTDIDTRDWIKLFGVDFGSGASEVQVRVASEKRGIIEVRLDSINGKKVSEILIPDTGGLNSWQTITTDVSGADGIHDLFFVFTLGGFHFNWWKFSGGESSDAIPPPVVKRISIRSVDNNLYVAPEEEMLFAGNEYPGDPQSFKLFDNEDGTYSFFNETKQKYVSCVDGLLGATSDNIESDEQRFLLMHSPNGSYCLFSQSEKSFVFMAENGSLQTGVGEPWNNPYRDVCRFWINYLDEPSLQLACTGNSRPWMYHEVPGKVEAENFDISCSDAGYFDTDDINIGNTYRLDEGVDIIPTKDQDGEYDVCFIASDEWLKYTFYVTHEGYYEVSCRVSSNSDQYGFHFELDDIRYEMIEIQRTGLSTDYSWFSDTIYFSEGENSLRIVFDNSSRGLNFNKMDFHFLENYTSLVNNKIQEELKVYPNPVQKKLNIANNILSIRKVLIMDIAGNIVLINNDPFKGNQVFDLSTLNSGQYIVRVEMDQGIRVSKLIKL